MRRLRRILGLLLILAVVLGVWVAIDLADHSRHSMRDFDPHEVARLETRMWRSYYDHRSFRLFADLVTLLRDQYHLSFWRAVAGAYHAARGAVVFQRGHERPDYLLALPDVVRYYELIASAATESFDVRRVSEDEVEWWIVHRQRDRHPPGDLPHALAILQSDIFHQTESDFAVHAQARADAMLLRDAGGDWGRIGELLDTSWTSLHAVVNR